jgi:DNA-directed RNA polymerase specialized sigma24 family protein
VRRVYDPKAPSSVRALAEFAKESVRAKLLVIAKLFTKGSEADADDLIAWAMMVVLDPAKDPWLKGSFTAHMGHAMRHAQHEMNRRAQAKRETVDEDATDDRRALTKEAPADAELHRRRELALFHELGERLMREIGAKHPIAKRVYELSMDDIVEAEEQAAILGCSVDEIHDAREIIKRHAKRIRDEYDQAEELRMKALREKSKNGPEAKS